MRTGQRRVRRGRTSGVYTYRMANAPMEAARAQNSSAVVSVPPAAPSSPAVNTATSSSPPASDLPHALFYLLAHHTPSVHCGAYIRSAQSPSHTASWTLLMEGAACELLNRSAEHMVLSQNMHLAMQ